MHLRMKNLEIYTKYVHSQNICIYITKSLFKLFFYIYYFQVKYKKSLKNEYEFKLIICINIMYFLNIYLTIHKE